MKRFFALLLCVFLLLSFAACGSSEKDIPTTQPAVTIPVTEPAPTVAPTETPEVVPAVPVVMDNTTLVDNNAVTFTIVKTQISDHAGMQLHVNCVNKTESTLVFSWDMVSVCGYMYDPLWSVEVAAGKSANSIIELDTYALENMGVLSVDEISFTLRIFDSENWMSEPVLDEAFTIYPTGLNADTISLPQRPVNPYDTVIIDDENVSFVIASASESGSSRYTLSVYLQNKTDRNLMYSWDLVSVNGIMLDPFWASSVAAGKNACSEINFYRSDLEANGIQEISEIEFTLIVSDYDNWEAGNLLEKTFTYRAESVG